MDTTKAIRDRLVADTTTLAALASFSGAPAIFADRAPDAFKANQHTPCVVLATPFADDPSDTFTEFGRVVRQDVRIYARETGSSAVLNALALRIRDLLHARPSELTVTGGRVNGCTVTGPVEAPTTDPALIGRRLTLRLTLQKD